MRDPKWLIARKAHTCDWCGEAIRSGDQHVTYVGRQHADCYAEASAPLDDDEITGGHMVAPDNDEDPRRAEYYDRDGRPLSFDAWATARADGKQVRVATTLLPNGYRVITVWLGINHRFRGPGLPLIFETTVTRSQDGRYHGVAQEFYGTEVEARRGHAGKVREWSTARVGEWDGHAHL